MKKEQKIEKEAMEIKDLLGVFHSLIDHDVQVEQLIKKTQKQIADYYRPKIEKLLQESKSGNMYCSDIAEKLNLDYLDTRGILNWIDEQRSEIENEKTIISVEDFKPLSKTMSNFFDIVSKAGEKRGEDWSMVSTRHPRNTANFNITITKKK